MKLGDVVRDKISGFSGVLTCRCLYLNSCVRWAVSPRLLREAKPVDSLYFDEEQLEIVPGEESIGFVQRDTGGDRPVTNRSVASAKASAASSGESSPAGGK